MKGFGLFSRLSFGFRTLLGSLLVVAAALLVIVLTNWNYVRVDLSAAGRNTLDEKILEVIDNLPGKVRADVFIGNLPDKFRAVQDEVLYKLQRVLSAAQESRRAQFEYHIFDVSDPGAAKTRQEELGVKEVNIVVFSSEDGMRRSRQKIYGDMVSIDWGSLTTSDLRILRAKGIFNPYFQGPRPDGRMLPARLSAANIEEVLTASLMRIADGAEIKAYFAQGQGEPELQNVNAEGLSLLFNALEGEGFEVSGWEPSQSTAVPEDCTVLVLLGCSRPYPPGTLDAVERFAKAGGRVIVVPSLETQKMDPALVDTAQGLLPRFGLLALNGRVCEPLVNQDPSQARQVDERVRVFRIAERLATGSPITQPLRDAGRSILFDSCVAFQRGDAMLPVTELATTSPAAWRDLVGAQGVPDYRRDPRIERSEVLRVAMDVELFAATPLGGVEAPRGRVLAMGSSAFFQNVYFEFNQDFIRNAFNSLAERTHRIRVKPLPSGLKRMDLQRSSAGEVLRWSLYLGLPGLCALVGLSLSWRRRS